MNEPPAPPRLCVRCGQSGEFGVNRRYADGLHRTCKACTRKSFTSWRERNLDYLRAYKAAHERGQQFDGRQPKLSPEERRQRAAEKQLEWRRANAAHLTEQYREWRRAHPEQYRAWRREYHVRRGDIIRQQRQLHSRARRCQKARGRGLTLKQWREIVDVFGGACAYCRRTDMPLQIEHVVALARGGEHDPDNIVPACATCNVRKNARPVWVMAGL